MRGGRHGTPLGLSADLSPGVVLEGALLVLLLPVLALQLDLLPHLKCVAFLQAPVQLYIGSGHRFWLAKMEWDGMG